MNFTSVVERITLFDLIISLVLFFSTTRGYKKGFSGIFFKRIILAGTFFLGALFIRSDSLNIDFSKLLTIQKLITIGVTVALAKMAYMYIRRFFHTFFIFKVLGMINSVLGALWFFLFTSVVISFSLHFWANTLNSKDNYEITSSLFYTLTEIFFQKYF